MAISYLYVIEMAVNGQEGQTPTGAFPTVVKDAFAHHPDIPQFKFWGGNICGLQSGGQQLYPVPWVMVMFLQTTESQLNKIDLDNKAKDIMQRVKAAFPQNIVVGVDFQVDVLPTLL